MKIPRHKEVKQKIAAAMSSTADLAKTLDRDYIGEEYCRRNGINIEVYRAFVRYKKKKQIKEYYRKKGLYESKNVHTVRETL